MSQILTALIESSVTMSVIAILYITVTPLISKKYAAKSRYYTWLIVAIGFLIPFRFHLTLPAIAVETPILAEVPLPLVNFTATAQAAGTVTALQGISVLSVIFALWLFGAAIFLCYHLNRHRKFLKLVKRWSEDVSDAKTIAILECVKNRFAITRPVRLKTCVGISSPMLIGFFKPTVLLGTQQIPESELPLIFEHELVHFMRGDLWVKAVVLLTASLHWFNPIVHIMTREIGMACELSCDAEVTKNANLENRRRYVESIVGIIRQQAPAKTALCTNFYSGRQGMKKRVLSIMDGSRKKLGVLLPALILLFTLSTGAVFALSRPQAVPAPVSPQPNQTVTEPAADPAPVTVPKPVAPTTFAVSADENGRISAHKIDTNNIYVYGNFSDSAWALKQGEKATIILELDEAAPTGQASIGYVLNGSMAELCSGSIESGITVTFTAPRDGEYRFYAENSSDIAVSVEAFSFLPAWALIPDNGYQIVKL